MSHDDVDTREPAVEAPPRIFMSYRRDDSQGFARSIHDRLALHFGADAVFRDINDIEPGMPWEEAIDEALASCDVFVLLIGREWLEAVDDDGNRRLDDPEDRHRREIETAIDRKIRIFVALMEDAHMPGRKQLPQAPAGVESSGIQKVSALHALRIADHAFDYGIQELVTNIERATQAARISEEQRGHDAAAKQEAEADAERKRAEERRLEDAEAERKRQEAEAELERQREEAGAERRREEEAATHIHEAPERDREEATEFPVFGREGRGSRIWKLAAVALGAVAVAVVAFLIVSSGGGGAEVVGEPVQVGELPVTLADDGAGGIWVTNRVGGTVSLIAADDQRLVDSYEAGPAPEGVAIGAGFVLVTNRGGADTVTQIGVEDGQKVTDFGTGREPGQIAIGEGALWVANSGEDSVSRFVEGAPRENIDVGDEPYGLAVGGGAVWVTNRKSGSVTRIDAAAEEADPPILVGENPKGIDVSDDAVWVANTNSGTVSKIDLEDNSNIETFDVGTEPRGVVVEFDSVWVTLGTDNEVARLNPESGDVEQRIHVGSSPEGLTAGSDSIWVANGIDGTVTRISP